MRGSIGLKKRRSFLVPQLCFDPIGKNLVEKSESLECWILRIVIRSWALDFYNEVGFRHLIRSKGAIGSQWKKKEEIWKAMESFVNMIEKKLRLAKIKRINFYFFSIEML